MDKKRDQLYLISKVSEFTDSPEYMLLPNDATRAQLEQALKNWLWGTTEVKSNG